MKLSNPLVTAAPWYWGTATGHGIKGVLLNPCRSFDGSLFRDGRWRHLAGTLGGLLVPSREEADRLALLYGYCERYGRNTCRFVMSRAARRRGHVSLDPTYLRRQMEGQAKHGR